MSKKIGLIIGSVRTYRVGDKIAKWFLENSGITSKFKVDVIDLREENLPFYDEMLAPMAMKQQFTKEHGKRWQAKINSYDGFVFVASEYNFGYAPALKNAIDYLFEEWKGKPAVIVSYGYAVAGTSSAAQLRHVLEKSMLGMKVMPTMPSVKLEGSMFNEQGQFKDINKSFEPFKANAEKAVEELSGAF
ncbi:NADPH-dependent FMN reductase family protein [Cavenderia fasciculata]|uniref:NADPH-dependent FMN reductase family protein n=1 Tax=Cavenderia fasciculata TaxID=261658 RepID=F4PKY7_CACFS|nr:NADPH-dependent FMN reductase family protein [Cavenderia fasciculata]EGG23209.1 NADPH-dependent FMN reductase family protein [Cavenderia fasciculata]|eukprot:XP_004361060.1 NADPH-dependent FMN reductase family protein [Cavenderia fasciculata]